MKQGMQDDRGQAGSAMVIAMLMMAVFSLLGGAFLTISLTESLIAARHAAGSNIAAVEAVMTGTTNAALCAVRPCGHHAERERAMGKALDVLWTGPPPSDPYVCATIVETSAGPISYTITYVRLGSKHWTVRVEPTSPGDDPSPLPSSF